MCEQEFIKEIEAKGVREMKILNCRNFRCKFNDKGGCRLESITLQDVGSPIISNVICIEAETIDKDDKPLDLETVWGIPKEDMPE